MEQDGIMYVRLWLFATSIDAGTGIGAVAALVAGAVALSSSTGVVAVAFAAASSSSGAVDRYGSVVCWLISKIPDEHCMYVCCCCCCC